MPPHTIRRQPLSCENCRTRKIKCTGGRAPCNSCVRRGFPSSCYFRRDSANVGDSAIVNSLVERISSLEALLKKQLPTTEANERQSRLPSPAETSNSASACPNRAEVPAKDSFHSPDFHISGSLLKTPDGYIRFVPHMVNINSEDLATFMQPSGSPSHSLTPSDCVVSNQNSPVIQELLDLLPPKSQCHKLVDRYFIVFSHMFHILHDPTFRKTYTMFCQTPKQTPLAFLALLFVILSIASLTLEDDDALLEDLSRETDGVSRLRSLAARYRAAALKCLYADQFMLRHNLYTVKALVLLVYAMSHSEGPGWPILGLTLHIATAIGCHIDPSHLDVGQVECEERRRCWAGLKMLYQNHATCMGNFLPNPVVADVKLPSDINDVDISDAGTFTPSHQATLPKPPTQMTYILYKFRLYEVATEVCRAALKPLPLQSPILSSLDSRIALEESDFNERFANVSDQDIHHRANMHILRNYTNQLYLILHKPYLNSNLYRYEEGSPDMELLRKSRQRCQSAAIALLDSHRQLYETPEFRNYNWYVSRLGSFGAFLGASTLLAVILDQRLLSDSDLDQQQLLKTVQQLTIRLEEMAGRSVVCEKAAQMLRRLLRGTEQLVEDRNGRHSGGIGNFMLPLDMPMMERSDIANYPYHNPDISGIRQEGEVDKWLEHPELDRIMSQVPPEQWLTPSNFSWDSCWVSEPLASTELLTF